MGITICEMVKSQEYNSLVLNLHTPAYTTHTTYNIHTLNILTHSDVIGPMVTHTHHILPFSRDSFYIFSAPKYLKNDIEYEPQYTPW